MWYQFFEREIFSHSEAIKAKSKLERPPDPRFQNQQQQGGRNVQQSNKGAKFHQQQQQIMLATARAIANGDKRKSNFAMVTCIFKISFNQLTRVFRIGAFILTWSYS